MKQNTAHMNCHNDPTNELSYLESYLEELKSIPPAKDDEILRLFALHAAGDESAHKRLTEAYLPIAPQIAAEFCNQGIPLADLIQEANMELVTMLSKPMLTQYSTRESYDSVIKDALRRILTQAVQIESAEQKTGKHLAEQINALNHASQDLAARHGKDPSVNELAEYLHMTEDEVKSYMKMSLDAIQADMTPASDASQE